MKLSPRISKAGRRFFFFIHLWTGLILGLWFVMIGLTGASLAWPELIAAEMKAMFPMHPAPGQPQIGVSQALAAVQKNQPDITAKELAFVILPNYRFPFYIFTRTSKPFKDALFLVDPYSGKVNPPRRVLDFTTGKLEYLHVGLILGAKGLLANGIGSVMALLLLLSGLWLWWPSTVRQFKARTRVKRYGSWRRKLIELHNVMGIYLYAVLLVTTVTAVALVYDSVTGSGLEKALDRGVPAAKAPVVVPHGARLSDDALLLRAHSVLPADKFFYIKRPVVARDPFIVYFQRAGMGFFPEGTLSLNPYGGKVLAIERDATASRGKKTMALINDLHDGLFLGLWSKILYTLAGLIPLGLYITGLAMWYKRKRTSWRQAAQSRRSGSTGPVDKEALELTAPRV